MTGLAGAAACSVSQRLLDLLDEARGLGDKPPWSSFGDRLDALEIEALETCAAGGTLVVIGMTREAVRFSERMAASPRRA